MNRLPDVDPEFAQTIRLSPLMMRDIHPSVWLERVELQVGRLCDMFYVTPDRELMIEFWFESEDERLSALDKLRTSQDNKRTSDTLNQRRKNETDN